METIGKRIKDLREKRKLSSALLAKKLGIEEGLLLEYESGEKEVATDIARKIAKLFAVPENYVLFGMKADSSMYTMFPNKGKPERVSAGEILLFISAMLLFIGIGGIIMIFVMNAARMDTVGAAGFFNYFVLSGSVYTAGGLLVIAVIGAAVGLLGLYLYAKKDRGTRESKKGKKGKKR